MQGIISQLKQLGRVRTSETYTATLNSFMKFRAGQDILLCEDSPGEQFIRGVTQDGEIYNFARTLTNDTEFCGACFDPDGQTLYVNQQGERGGTVDGPPNGNAVTYAIYGPFEKRAGSNNKNFGNGRGA